MTALATLFTCFGPTRPAPRRSVSLTVESLEARRIIELETATKWSAVDESVWRARRPSWLRDMRAAATPTDVDLLRQEFAEHLI